MDAMTDLVQGFVAELVDVLLAYVVLAGVTKLTNASRVHASKGMSFRDMVISPCSDGCHQLW